jgi:putative FmdB family regulatory protein
MPTYDYICDNCGNKFETFQSIKDEPLKKCEKCGQEALRRLIGGGAGLIFKGSGFYLTDYKNKGGESSSSSSSKASGGKTETRTDTAKKDSGSGAGKSSESSSSSSGSGSSGSSTSSKSKE